MKKNRETEKLIVTQIKQEVKKNNMHLISNCIYNVIKNYFVFAIFWCKNNREKISLFFRMNIKAYNYDDLFWTIFGMSENSNSKESLRANGAFNSPSYQFKEKAYEIFYDCDISEIIKNAIIDFNTEANNFINYVISSYGNYDLFILSQNDILDDKLLKMLANISQGNYYISKQIAISEIEQRHSGGYVNKGKDIYEYIIEYCNSKL